MKPYFYNNDLKMFYKYLDRSSNYFEFGSGGSTYQAIIRSNIKKVYSVESDKTWYNIIKSKINNDNFYYFFIDLKSKPNNLGYPGNCSIDEYRNYSDIISYIPKNLSNEIDLILIDGRFRVSCALKVFTVINKKTKVIFDDFLDRPQYKIVLKYYKIIESTKDKSMVVLKKRKNIENPSNELISKYELDPR